MASTEGSANIASQRLSGGMCSRGDHEVGGVRDRQHEARRVGDEGADEEVGQRVLDAGGLGGGVDRRGQHDRAGVVRQEDRDHRADTVDQGEQARGRAPGRPHGDAGEPVEQPLLPGDLRHQHHADEEEVDVRALEDAFPGGPAGISPNTTRAAAPSTAQTASGQENGG